MSEGHIYNPASATCPRWSFSEKRGELFGAMAALDIGAIAKTKEVEFMTDKGKISFLYAPLDSILPVVKLACQKHDLALIQFISFDSMTKECVVVTTVGHCSGQWLEITLSLPVVVDEKKGIDPKKFASLATYLKRYQVGAVFAIATEEDSDGSKLGTPYSGDDEDRLWLLKVFEASPHELGPDIQKAVATRLRDEGIIKTQDAVNAIILEEIEK